MDLFGTQARKLLELEQAKSELLEARIVALKEDLERVLSHNRQLAQRPIPQRSDTPLYMSESEEDVRFMKDTEQITILEAEQLLRELEFDNETILLAD